MTVREQRRQEWNVRIADYKASGLTMSAWCITKQCTKEQLKYWLRKAKEMPSSAPTTQWVPLAAITPTAAYVPASSSLVVRVGQAHIELRSGFDPRLLLEIVKALEAIC